MADLSALGDLDSPMPVYTLDAGRLVGEVTHLPPPKLGDTDTSERPAISCLMVTRERPALARRAIRCFQAQSYSNRELVIVDDDPDDALTDHVCRLADPRIKHHRLPDRNTPLGDLRNIAVEGASGEFLCQWDDDDISDPRRLACQMASLQSLQTNLCFLLHQMIWWPNQRRIAVSRPRVWEGTVLAPKHLFSRYPSLRKGEDTEVTASLLRTGRAASLCLPRLYIYTVHGRNTFDTAHFDAHWETASAQFYGADYERALRLLDIEKQDSGS